MFSFDTFRNTHSAQKECSSATCEIMAKQTDRSEMGASPRGPCCPPPPSQQPGRFLLLKPGTMPASAQEVAPYRVAPRAVPRLELGVEAAPAAAPVVVVVVGQAIIHGALGARIGVRTVPAPRRPQPSSPGHRHPQRRPGGRRAALCPPPAQLHSCGLSSQGPGQPPPRVYLWWAGTNRSGAGLGGLGPLPPQSREAGPLAPRVGRPSRSGETARRWTCWAQRLQSGPRGSVGGCGPRPADSGS